MMYTNKQTGTEFISVTLLEVIQGGKFFYIGIVPASVFIKMYTVEPVIYDIENEIARQKQFPDLQEYFDKSISEKKKALDEKGFQRQYDEKRVAEITKFINAEEYPFFPNSIITTCDVVEEEAVRINNNKYDRPILRMEGDAIKLDIPIKSSSLLVIDGQHRLLGLSKATPSVIDDYNLIVSFILGYDRSVIARLFYTINYTQKSVNKSLLYHLTGEFSEDLNEITFLHEVVKTINESDNSPFFKRIKMLGTAPKQAEAIDKKIMTLSQAFLIDYLLYTIKDRNSSSLIQPIFNYYFKSENKYEIVRFIVSYFTAVKKIFPEWEKPDDSILSKTTGVGALLKVMNFIFLKLFFQYGLDKEPMKIREFKSDQLVELLKGIEQVRFDQYLGTSSAGTVNQVKDVLISSIEFIDRKQFETTKAFEESFKNNYSIPFCNWLHR